MVDIRQSREYANYLAKVGWIVERKGGVNYFIKKFPLIGSVIKIQRPEELQPNDIKILSAKYRAFQIIIEPKDIFNDQWLMANGFKSSNSPYLPRKTLLLDLDISRNRLLRNMKKDARNAINNSKIIVKSCKKLEEFRKAWKKAVGWKRYVPPLSHLTILKKSFKENCLFLMEENGNSGTIFLIGDKIGYYWQAFTNDVGRRNLAQYKIVWEGILWTKRSGARIFDFEGIYDERFPDKSWLGFTHFKKSFGGHELEYPGCFVKTMLPLTQ